MAWHGIVLWYCNEEFAWLEPTSKAVIYSVKPTVSSLVEGLFLLSISSKSSGTVRYGMLWYGTID